jgi:hypothetical protein
MSDQGHIIATCQTCGFRFDVIFGLDCPACRKQAVAEAFKPVDPLRTALGIWGTKLESTIELRFNPEDHKYYRAEKLGAGRPSFLVNQYNWEAPEEVPEGCKMPTDEAEQIYQLRRLFRL